MELHLEPRDLANQDFVYLLDALVFRLQLDQSLDILSFEQVQVQLVSHLERQIHNHWIVPWEHPLFRQFELSCVLRSIVHRKELHLGVAFV